jgi:glycosyltransferase involved in cell wall biosynthesis
MAKLLVLNFFPAFFPASSGGELRLGNLYRALAREHDITMLTSTNFDARFEDIRHVPGFKEFRFPKDQLWRRAYATLEKSGLFGDLSGLAFAMAVSDPDCKLRQTAWELAGNVDYIVHEFPFSEPIFTAGAPRPEIYNSHNFEASLLGSITHGSGFDAALLKLLRLEGNLTARAEKVFATSEADATKFRLFYGIGEEKLALCPNGFDDAELKDIAKARARTRKANSRPKLLFMGSGHPPNVEAAGFMVELASALPHCDIILAGGVASAMAGKPVPLNVTLFGPFDDAAKRRLMTEADIFLNPVTLGSGTSLKALEALGAHLPMVSTPEGARGLGLIDGQHARLVNRPDFAAAIISLLADRAGCDQMAKQGLAWAEQKFTWTKIAENFGAAIAAPAVATPAPPLCLALNDYPVDHSNSGGIARIRNLLENISADIVLVTFGQNADFILISPRLLLITVPKTPPHLAYERAVNENQKMSVNDGVASLFAASNRVLSAITQGLARRAAAVIFEHPYMAPLLAGIRQVAPEIPVIYSAHNVEARHKAEMLKEHSAGIILAEFIAAVESYLTAEAGLILACTEADAAYFAAQHGHVIVVPNGCVVPERAVLDGLREPNLDDQPPRIGFLGSSHGPNVTALEFILADIAPNFPELEFEVVGTVCTAIAAPELDNVRFLGIVDEGAKSKIMANWTLALNPIESGGGSSLKLPDFMAHGLPTINTAAGARGFDVVGHNAGYVAKLPQFATTMLKALANRARLHGQADNAYHYAATALSWEICTAAYRGHMQTLFGTAPPAPDPQKSLLVVTYRYTEPPLGGAEEYLIEVLKHLRPRFARLDLAALDVGHITNHHHFSTQAAGAGEGPTARVAEMFDQALYFAPDKLPEDTMERCRELERGWAQEEQGLLAPFARLLRKADRLRLFGGFFWPENHDGVTKRWTSPNFCFLAPPGAWIFRLTGYASCEKKLTITTAQIAPDCTFRTLATIEKTVPSVFAASFSLPPAEGDDPMVILCSIEEHHAEGDHRPFGVLLERVSILVRDGEGEIGVLDEIFADLGEENESELRANEFPAWIKSLHNIALRHSDEAEQNFAAVRGPHSAGMQAWLAQHAKNYDAVLVQGIPFDVIPRTIETLSPLNDRPRLVTLPHFHGDDRFYYWRRYLDCFAAADKNLFFSESIADSLALDGRAAVVPGGGVRTDEHGDPGALGRFRAVHSEPAPYFLVLGRKTSSKGYERAIAAQQVLRREGVIVDVVLIGPDEDGRAVHGEGAHYLGRQPREVVRGALQGCLGLISMSTSESFGIVLCEAWLFGKPVIANRACYSFRELVRDGENGFLVGTDAELAGAMKTMLEDEEARLAMGAGGFADVQEKYTWPAVASAIHGTILQTERQQ